MKTFKKGYEFFLNNSSNFYGAYSGGEYVNNVKEEIDRLMKDINSFAGTSKNIGQLKGDIAEFWHSGTHNIDAAVKGLNARTYVDRSNEFASADVTSNFGESYGLKYYKTGSESAKQQSESIFQKYSEYKAKAIREGRYYHNIDEYLKERGYKNRSDILDDPIYSGQIRIIPKDQLEEATNWLEKKIREESVKRPDQVPRYQETLEKLKDKIESSDRTESIPLTKAEAEELGRLAKEDGFNPEEFGLTTEEFINYKYVIQQAYKAGVTAATITMVLKIAPEMYKTIEYLVKTGEIDGEQFQKVGFVAVQGGAEGFLRGSAAAAITTSCKAGLLGESLKKVNASIIGASTAILMNTMKNSFMTVNGDMTNGQLIDSFVKDMFLSSCSLVMGGVTQTLIQIPTLGFMIGSFVGSIVGNFAYNTTYNLYMSLCVRSGYTMFGIVDQNYSLPSHILNEIGIEVFEYERFTFSEVQSHEYKFKEFQPQRFEYHTLGLTMVKRGVIGVNKIGYV